MLSTFGYIKIIIEEKESHKIYVYFLLMPILFLHFRISTKLSDMVSNSSTRSALEAFDKMEEKG